MRVSACLAAGWIATLQMGCVSVHKDALPQQSSSVGSLLEDFAGTYVMIADTATDLGLFKYQKRYAGDTLTLQASGSTVAATYRCANGAMEQAVIDVAAKPQRLRRGRLEYEFPRFEGARLGLGYSDRNHFMYLQPDGSLVIATASIETGMALLIFPLHESYRSVYRFRSTAK